MRSVVLGLLHLGAPHELTSTAEGERNVRECCPQIFDTAQLHATAFQILLTSRPLGPHLASKLAGVPDCGKGPITPPPVLLSDSFHWT